MRNWHERCPVACRNCGNVYVATPTADGFCVTAGGCDRCGSETFDPLTANGEDP